MCPDRAGDAQRLHGHGDVVRADEGRAVQRRQEVRRDRAAEPARCGSERAILVDEALARGTHHQGTAEALEFRKAGDHGHALPGALAEADAWVEHDRLTRDAGLGRDLERVREERADIGHDIHRRFGPVAVVHDDHRYAGLGDHPRHQRLALQAPHVIDDGGTARQCPAAATSRLDGVDRDRHAEMDDRRQDRRQPRQLLFQGDRLRPDIGPRRFGADVDDVGAFVDHLLGMLEGASRIGKLAAVGERVRGDVEDAHDDRAVFASSRPSTFGAAAGALRAANGPASSGGSCVPVIVMAGRFARGAVRCQAPAWRCRQRAVSR